MSNQLQQNSVGGVMRGTKSASSMLAKFRKTKMFDQLCLLVLDGSNSMTWDLNDEMSKAEAATFAVKELINLLKKSSKSAGFSLAIICFADVVETRLYPQYIDKLEMASLNCNPATTKGEGTSTLIGDALAEAEKLGEAFLNSGDIKSTLTRTVRILLMSDGDASDPDECLEKATSIKQKWGEKIRINATLLANKEEDFEKAEALLSGVASLDANGKPYFTKTNSGAELRAFFEKSSTED